MKTKRMRFHSLIVFIITEKKRKELEEKEKAARELEERKHTPGYCRYCGSEHAEYIPFEGEWMCEDCYYDMHYY